MEYENKTNKELIELLESKDEELSEYEESAQTIDELSEEISDYESRESEYNESLADRESVSELAFDAGHAAGANNSPVVKSCLNYKIEAKLWNQQI